MIRVILANASIECELSDLSAVMATVNPGKVVEPVAVKVPEPLPEPTKVEIPNVKVLTCAETFASWNIGDVSTAKMRQAWFGATGSGVVKVGPDTHPGGFFGFLAFLRTRNPGRTATRAQLWDLFRFMPWAQGTFIQNMYLVRHQHGWTWDRKNEKYIASK